MIAAWAGEYVYEVASMPAMEAATIALAGRTVIEAIDFGRPASRASVGATVAVARLVEERSDCFTEFRSKKRPCRRETQTAETMAGRAPCNLRHRIRNMHTPKGQFVTGIKCVGATARGN